MSAMAVVTLLLAFMPERPDGDVNDRLVLQLPLSATGHIDNAAYTVDSDAWRYARERPDGGVSHGAISPSAGGWTLQDDASDGDAAEELAGSVVRPGDYMIVRTRAAGDRVYRIVSVEPG